MNLNTKPKIFIVSPTESLMTKRGNRHPVLAEKLKGYGYNITYLTTNYYHAEKRKFTNNEINEFITNVPYRVKVVSTIAFSRNISIKRLMGNIKAACIVMFYLLKHCYMKDILIVPSRPPEFMVFAALLKYIRCIKVVIDVRDIWPDGLPLNSTITHKIFKAYCNALNSYTACSGDYYMYTSSGFIEWIHRYKKNSNADFVPLGFDINRWKKCRPLIEQNIESVIKFVYVGDLASTIEIEPFVHAIARNDNFSLTFIGGGEKLQEIKNLVDKLNALNVHFKGFIPKEQVVAEMQNFHITVIPMKVKYVMPNKMFDSIGCFRPILVFGYNDAADFVKTNDIGWVLPFDTQEVRNFFDTLDKKEILVKSRNIARIRDSFSKDFLYAKAIGKIVE